MRIIQSDNPRPLNLLAIGAGGLVAAASSTFGAPGDIEVWDAATGTRRFVHREPDGFLPSLTFHPNGRTLIFSRQRTVLALDLTPGEEPRVLRRDDNFPEVALSPDGTSLLICENQQTELQTADGEIACYALGDRLDLTLRWAARAESAALFRPVFRADGARFALTARDLSGARVRHSVQLLDSSSDRLLVTIPTDPASPVHQTVFTADGAKLLVRTDSRTVQMFDAATGAPAGELVHTGRPYVTAIAVHPRGPVACARTNGTVTFWEIPSGLAEGTSSAKPKESAAKREQLRTLDWKAGKLVSVAFSPDGALAAAGTEDGKIVVWDVDL